MKRLFVVLLAAALSWPSLAGGIAAAATPKITTVTLSGKAGNVTLDAGTRQIRWAFDYAGLTADDKVSWRLYQGARQLLFDSIYSGRDLIGNKIPPSGTVKVTTPVQGGFGPGFYRVEMKVNDQVEQTAAFTVLPKGKTPVFANVVFADTASVPEGDVQYPLAVKYNFDPGATESAVFDHFNLDKAKTWGWRLTREGALVDQKLDQAWTGNPQGTFALPFTASTQPGVYDFDLLRDGKWAAAGSFTVGQSSPASARVLQADDFSDPKTGWDTQKTAVNWADYESGQFVVSLGADLNTWSSMSGKKFSDGIAEIEVTPRLDQEYLILQLTEGFQKYGSYGLVARFQDSQNFYVFAVRPAGVYSILLVKDGALHWIKNWTQPVQDVYPFGEIKTARLRVLTQGSILRFYINDRLVDVVPDAAWPDGMAGAMAATTPGEPLEVAFDNWRILSLDQAGPAAAAAPLPATAPAGQKTELTLPTVQPAAQPQAETQPPKSSNTSTGSPSSGRPPSGSAGLATTTEKGAPGIRLQVADWAPPLDASNGGWGVVPAGGKFDKKTFTSSLDQALAVPPGKYDVYWVQDYDHGSKPLLVAPGVTVTDQGTVVLKVDSGIRLDVAGWVPKRDETNGWWGAVPAGQKPDKRVNWTKSDPAILLASGTYDVYWVQDYDHGSAPLLIAKGLEVSAGGATPLKVDSGVQLDVADWIPKRDEQNGWWGAVPAGQKPDKRVNWTKTDAAIALPPGAYDVYWVQDYDHGSAPLLIAKSQQVSAGAATSLKLDSGVQLTVADWIPKRDDTNGWWGAVPAGQKPDKRINWTKTDAAIALPPGTYDVYWVQDYDHGSAPLLIAKGLQVNAGAATSLKLDSGVQLNVADWVPKRDETNGWWGAVPAGQKPDRRVNWTKTDAAIALPPGAYDVYWVQDYDHGSRPLLLASGVNVAAGAPATVEATSGIKLTVAAGTPPLDSTNGWWGVAPSGKTANDRIAWWVGKADLPLLVPPGTYDLYWKQDYPTAPKVLQKGVVVKTNGVTEVQAQP